MEEIALELVCEWVDSIYHSEFRRTLATLSRLLGDFDLVEGAFHDAFRAALQKRPKDGVPHNLEICLFRQIVSKPSTLYWVAPDSKQW